MDYPHRGFTPTTAEGQHRHKVFSRLWMAANEDVDADSSGYNLPADSVRDWLERRGFPLIMGEGHCFRCHGFEDGPCEGPEGHGAFACPGCVREDQERRAAVEALMRRPVTLMRMEDDLPITHGGNLPSEHCVGPPCSCPEAAHE